MVMPLEIRRHLRDRHDQLGLRLRAGEGEHFRGVDWQRSDVERTSLKHDLRAFPQVPPHRVRAVSLWVGRTANGGAGGRARPRSRARGSPLPNRIEDLSRTTPTPMTVRELLDIAEVDRRTAQSVASIDELLQASGLASVPSISDAEIDEQIVITPLQGHPQTEAFEQAPSLSDSEHAVGYRIHQNPSARRAPRYPFSRDDLISDARTAMLEGNFSQLAVVEAGGLAGVITWESIAIAHMHGNPTIVAKR